MQLCRSDAAGQGLRDVSHVCAEAEGALTPWPPAHPGGFVLGILAASLLLGATLYPWRRRIRVWPLTTAQRWRQVHVWGGTAACLAVALHTGFRWPQGRLGTWIVVLTGWTLASGGAGALLQKWLPRRLSNDFSVEAVFERLPALAARLQPDADRAVEGASDVLARVYRAEIRPMLAGLRPSWSLPAAFRTTLARQLAPLHAIAPLLSESERERFDDLVAIVTEKLELDAHYSLQRLLRYWHVLHVPPTGVIVGLVVWHVMTVYWY